MSSIKATNAINVIREKSHVAPAEPVSTSLFSTSSVPLLASLIWIVGAISDTGESSGFETGFVFIRARGRVLGLRIGDPSSIRWRSLLGSSSSHRSFLSLRGVIWRLGIEYKVDVGDNEEV